MSHEIDADVVRRMLDGFSADVEAMQLGIVDGRTPEPARRVLAAALIYIVEPLDLVPDVLDGTGLLDDAVIIRLAARSAVATGAAAESLRRLAREADELAHLLGDLLVSLDAYLAGLQRPNARGLTPADVIGDVERRMELWRQLDQRRSRPRAANLNVVAAFKNMRALMRHRLERLDPGR